MSRFGKYLGYATINVGGEAIEIVPTLRDKQELMGVQMKNDGKLSPEDWNTYHTVFRRILKKSEPEATDEELDAFLVKHDIEFMLELFKVLGWSDDKKTEDLKKNLNQNQKV